MDFETSKVVRLRRMLDRPSPGRDAARDLWLHGVLMMCGAVPSLGYALHGEWDPTDLSIGLMLLLFSAPRAVSGFGAWFRGKRAVR